MREWWLPLPALALEPYTSVFPCVSLAPLELQSLLQSPGTMNSFIIVLLPKMVAMIKDSVEILLDVIKWILPTMPRGSLVEAFSWVRSSQLQGMESFCQFSWVKAHKFWLWHLLLYFWPPWFFFQLRCFNDLCRCVMCPFGKPCWICLLKHIRHLKVLNGKQMFGWRHHSVLVSSLLTSLLWIWFLGWRSHRCRLLQYSDRNPCNVVWNFSTTDRFCRILWKQEI